MFTSTSVKDYMTASLITFTPDMDVLEAIRLLLENGISGAPVVDKLGNIIGILSERDCIKVALTAGYHGEKGGKVAEFMSRSVKTIDATASLMDVAKRFVRHCRIFGKSSYPPDPWLQPPCDVPREGLAEFQCFRTQGA
jgi:CBS domain-containing protein